MACIGKLGASLVAPCGAPAKSVIGRPIGAKILNASQIASYTVVPSSAPGLGLATITRVTDAVGYGLTARNNALVVTVGLKSTDIIPGAYDVTITFKSFSGEYFLSSTADPLGGTGVLERAEIVIAVDHGDAIKVYGLGVPLVCKEIAADSSVSEFVTYTFGVEDWQVGTTIQEMSRADYDALSTPAV